MAKVALAGMPAAIAEESEGGSESGVDFVESYTRRWNKRWDDMKPPERTEQVYGEVAQERERKVKVFSKLNKGTVRGSINLMPSARKNSRYGVSSSAASNDLLRPIKANSPYIQIAGAIGANGKEPLADLSDEDDDPLPSLYETTPRADSDGLEAPELYPIKNPSGLEPIDVINRASKALSQPSLAPLKDAPAQPKLDVDPTQELLEEPTAAPEAPLEPLPDTETPRVALPPLSPSLRGAFARLQAMQALAPSPPKAPVPPKGPPPPPATFRSIARTARGLLIQPKVSASADDALLQGGLKFPPPVDLPDDDEFDDLDITKDISPAGSHGRKSTEWLKKSEDKMPGLLTWRVGKSFEPVHEPSGGFPTFTTLGYEEACYKLGVVPSSRVCEGLKKSDCCLKHCHLGKRGAEAFSWCLKNNFTIRRLDLTACGLEQQSIQHVVDALAQNRMITFLNLSDNRLGVRGASALGALVQHAKGAGEHKPRVEEMVPLRILGLNKCELGNRGVAKVCSFLARNELLQELHLTGNGLLDTGVGAIAAMLEANVHLKVLDIGWNSIKKAGSHALKDALSHNESLHTLRLAWNGLDDAGGSAMGMMLYHNTGLTRLDLSNCRLGPDAALVLGEGLKHNSTLHTLVLSDNALGDDGGRHLMNGLSTNTSLRSLGLQGCSFTPGHIKGKAKFDSRNPDGHYKLDLSSPVEHAIAMQLVHLGKHSPTSWHDTRLNAKVIGPKYPGHLNWHIPGELPARGVLELVYVTTLGPPRDAEVIEFEDLDNLVQQLSTRRTSDMERLSLLRMFSASHYFTCNQAGTILAQFGLRCEERTKGAMLLFSRVVDSDNIEEMFNDSWTEDERQRFFKELGFVRYFQSKNPMGHYELNLAVQIDRLIMHKLIDAWRHEGGQKAKRAKKNAAKAPPPAKGAKGAAAAAEAEAKTRYMHLRNVVYQGRLSNGWRTDGDIPWGNEMPDHGYVRLDYSTLNFQKPKEAEAIAEEDLDRMIRERLSRPVPSDERVVNLRILSPRITLSCAQCVRLLALWERPEERAEVVVICYARLVDRAQAWTILVHLTGLEQMQVCWRIGYENLFDRKHPSMHYRLDLGEDQHRNIAKQLVTWAAEEKNFSSLHNMLVSGRWTKGALVEDDNLWSVLTNNPSTGDKPILEFDYVHHNYFEDRGQSTPQHSSVFNEKVCLLMKRELLARCCLMHAFWIEMTQWILIPDNFAEGEEVESPAPATTKKGGDTYRAPEVVAGSPLEKALSQTGARVLRPHHWQMGWDRNMRVMARTEKSWLEAGAGTPLKTLFWDKIDQDANGVITFDEFKNLGRATMGLSEKDEFKLRQMFREGDRDKDGDITWLEFEDAVLRGAM